MKRQLAARLRFAAVLAALCACAGAPQPFAELPPVAIRSAGLRGAENMLRKAGLFPQSLEEAHGWGVEPGGGVRAIVAGVRVVATGNGAMLVAQDRLAATPSSVVALPERLGGGFLFGIGTHLWRSATWLGAARGLFTSSATVAQVLVGLDRVYVRSPQGALDALDPRTGALMGLGPLPASPNIGRLAAFDGWRAVVIADLRGALLTVDAGSTWRRLALPIEPSDVVALENTIAVGGLGVGRRMEWWEVQPDGQIGKLSLGPPQSRGPAERPFRAIEDSPRGLIERQQDSDSAMHTFGPRPLASAIEDGWPMTDGTALVARDGALARVRLADGAVVESVANAFPLKPARCHAISLTQRRDPGALAFVCGQPRARTVVYRWDAPTGRLIELRGFESPREVLGFANGALAVRGPCAGDAPGDAMGGEQPWCLMAPEVPWREMVFPSEDRLVVLSDGRVELVRPPRAGDLATARLTVVDGAHSSQVPIVLSPLAAGAANALRMGIWMDGFEQRRPGVVGGWVDAAGALLGIEITATGEGRVGEYIRDAGAPVASGRWAFGWTASRRGFETTDGGMTWTKEIALPDPIASERAIHERVCGPVGCIAAGWLRVGWGMAGDEPATAPPPRAFPPAHSAPNLDLDCEPALGPASAPAPPGAPGAAATSRIVAGTYSWSTWGAVSELPAFAGRTAPILPADDLGLSVEASNGLERALRGVPLARIYAWGPKTGDWDQLGRWQVRWQWPWGGWRDVRSSTAVSIPWTSLDGARRALGIVPGAAPAWAIAEGGDPDHALLIARRGVGPAATSEIMLLETEHAPIEARRSNGEPFADLEGATRLGGRWYIATTQSPGEKASTIVWSLDSPTARELVRIPRAGFETRSPLRLARHTDGHAIGLVVDGMPDTMLGTTPRWVAAIDIESGSVATPEPLAPIDLSDREVFLCSGDRGGWEVDLPYPGAVRLRIGAEWEVALQRPIARMRLANEQACIERILGAADGYPSTPPGELTRSAPRPRPGARRIDASISAALGRYALRCSSSLQM